MACLAHVRKVFKQGWSGFDLLTMPDLDITDARPGWIRATLLVEDKHLNGGGNVHGGMMCSLVDNVTFVALSSMGSPDPNGVSSNIGIELVRPCGQKGDTIVCEARVAKLGARLAFLRIDFYVRDQLVAYGSQTVVVSHDMQTTFSEDGERVMPVEKRAKL